MDIRELKAFVALSEVLNYRRTAERLHVSQSALSKQIQRLESACGGALFERSKTTTHLSPLGRAILPEARKTLEDYDRLIDTAKAVNKGTHGCLRIGFGISSKKFVSDLLFRYRQHHPDVVLQLFEMSSQHQIDGMKSGEIDIGFCRVPAPADFQSLAVLKDSIVAVVPATRAASGTIADLVLIPMVTVDRHRAPSFYDHAMRCLAQSGIHTIRHQTVSDFSTAQVLAQAGVAWALVPESTVETHAHTIVIRFPSGSDSWEVCVAWPKARENRLIQSFVGTIGAMSTIPVRDTLTGK